MFKKAIVMAVLILVVVMTASVLVHSGFSQGKTATEFIAAMLARYQERYPDLAPPKHVGISYIRHLIPFGAISVSHSKS